MLILEKAKCRFSIQRPLVFLISMTTSGCSTQLEVMYLEHQVSELREELEAENQRLKEIKEKLGPDDNLLTTKSNRLKTKKTKAKTKATHKSSLAKKEAQPLL